MAAAAFPLASIRRRPLPRRFCRPRMHVTGKRGLATFPLFGKVACPRFPAIRDHTMTPRLKTLLRVGCGVVIVAALAISALVAWRPWEDSAKKQVREILDQVRGPNFIDHWLAKLGVKSEKTVAGQGKVAVQLAALGEPAAPYLAKALKDKDSYVR